MNLNKKIGVLLDNGFKPEFISSLNENKINFLFEKINKKENNEAETKNVKQTTLSSSEWDNLMNKGGDVSGTVKKNADNSVTITTEQNESEELDEKFESKAQQGLFWARCNKCKNKNCEWCKLAKEFSEKTTKKDYKTMPEKKHPEKTVKYKKKTKKENTNEEFTMANYFDKIASVYANNAMGKLTKEQIINKHLTNVIESNLNPTMKKKDLLKLIESEIKRKKQLMEDFYYDETNEQFDMSNDNIEWDEDQEADWFKWDDEEEISGPRSKFKMNDPFAPVIEPGIKEPKIKPKREIEPEWEPDFDEPDIDPDTESEPQARRRNKDMGLERFKDEFDRNLKKLDKVSYKPIDYKKF